jgi:hypothetical protein
MLARGNLAFEWSSIKNQSEIQNDRLECSRAVVHKLADDGEREFERCLEARGDLIIAGSQGEFPTREKTQAYLAPPPVPPARMCSNFANGDQRLFSQCMENSQSYSQRYCLDATNRNVGQYIQCMNERGFAVSDLPEEYAQSTNPPPGGVNQARSQEGGLSHPSPLPPLTSEQKAQIAADSLNTLLDISKNCEGNDHKLRCVTIHGLWGMRKEEKLMICRHPDILDQQPIAQIPASIRKAVLIVLQCPGQEAS